MLEAWGWDREALAAGEWWRWMTGHLVHLDAKHTVMNAFGAYVLWWLLRRDFSLPILLTVMATSLLTINVGLWFASSLTVYVGSSALLHGVAAAGIAHMIGQGERWGWPLAVVGILKLLSENIGATAWLMPGYRVAAEAHLWGVIGGLLGAIVWRLFWPLGHRDDTRSCDSQ
ncbi:MAG: rhombosortase [Steroidobacteraceae bacterium]|jgi:rhomboid family GlyGly-CTERM serine protease